MKKISKILLTIFVGLNLFMINVKASTANVSITANSRVTVGDPVAITVKYSLPRRAMWNVTSSGNVPGIGAKTFQPGMDPSTGGASTTTVTFSSPGTYTLNVSVAGTKEYDVKESVDGSASKTITVVEKTTKPETGGEGNSNGNGNGGSNNNGSGTKPGTSNPGTTKPDKELTEEEKKAKEEAEKKAQLEANQKIPLVDGIKITSRSPKMEGVALETLGTEEGTFSYSYELPKNIDRVGLELIPAIDGVELTYDKEIDFAADETSKTITANAKSGEISQDYEIVLTRTIPVVNKTEIDGKKLTVLDDETLDGNMKALGFERQEYEIEGGMGYFFANGAIKMQLLVDENNNGSWHLLDESNKPSEEVILLESGTNYALVMNAPEAMQKETLNTEKYSEKTVDFESRYTEVSTTLVMNNKYKAWTAEDGEVFYGIMNGGEKRLHFKAKNEDGLVFEKAFVGFDHTSGTSKTVAIVSTATLGIAVISGVIYTIMLKKKK